MSCTCCTDLGCCPPCPWCNHDPEDPECPCYGCTEEDWDEEDDYEFRGRW